MTIDPKDIAERLSQIRRDVAQLHDELAHSDQGEQWRNVLSNLRIIHGGLMRAADDVHAMRASLEGERDA